MRILLISFIIIQIYTNINAQTFKIGVSGTRNTPQLLSIKTIGGKLLVESHLAYQIEAHLLYNVYRQNGISIGVVYMPNRFDLTNAPYKNIASNLSQVTPSVNSYGLPILVNINIYKNLNLEIGGQLNFNHLKPDTRSYNIIDLSLRSGLSYRFNYGVYVFSYYNHALTAFDDRSFKLGLSSLALGAGYSF